MLDQRLQEALADVTHDDMLAELDRYRPVGTDYRVLYPALGMPLVRAVIDASDECPVCLARFLRLGAPHATHCMLAPLL